MTGEPSKDVNYIIPHFVLFDLPVGLTGIFIAAVMAAAMSAVAAELNSLATASVIDFYRRWVRPEAPDAHVPPRVEDRDGDLGRVRLRDRDVRGEPRFTHRGGEPLRLVLLRLDPRRLPLGDDSAARALGAFVGLVAGMSVVGAVNFGWPAVAFLWHNVIGAVTVVVVGCGTRSSSSADVPRRRPTRVHSRRATRPS